MSLRLGETIIAGSTDTSDLLPKSGGTMTGAITMGTNAIKFGLNNVELKAYGDTLEFNGIELPRVVTTPYNGTSDANGNCRLTPPTIYSNYLFVGFKGRCQWSGTSWTAEVTYTCMMDGYYINVSMPNGTTLQPQANKAVEGDAYWLVW